MLHRIFLRRLPQRSNAAPVNARFDSSEASRFANSNRRRSPLRLGLCIVILQEGDVYFNGETYDWEGDSALYFRLEVAQGKVPVHTITVDEGGLSCAG